MTCHIVFADADPLAVYMHNTRNRTFPDVFGGYIRGPLRSERVDWDGMDVGVCEGVEVVATFDMQPEDREIEALRDELGATALCVQTLS